MAKQAANDAGFRKLSDSLGSLSAVDGWVRSRYRYRDEAEEIVRTPQFMLADMGRMEGARMVGLEGDCDDVSTLLAAFALALGYTCRFVAIRYTPNNPNFEHVYTEAYDGADWVRLDATVPPGTPLHALETMTELMTP